MLDSVPLWLHILAAAIWVGSQVMLFVVVVPALRAAEDPRSRAAVLRGVTRRFGYLGTASLALLVLSGIDNVDRYGPPDMFDLRYGWVLTVKLALFAAVLVLTALHSLVIGPRLMALHSLVIGPRLMALQQAAAVSPDAATAARIRALRARSVVFSGLTLLLSIAILFCAALLRSGWSYEAV